MTANDDLRRRLARYYDTEPPLRAPDWVLLAALSTIESTPQRRGPAVLRRYAHVNTYLKLAAAAAVVAIAAYGIWSFAIPGVGGRPTPMPTATPRPTGLETPWSPYIPPALTGTFTSAIHGLSVSSPEGWLTRAATVPWTSAGPLSFGDPAGDVLYDAGETDHLFLGFASQLLGDASFDEWSTDTMATFAAEGCVDTEPVIVDGYDGVMGASCPVALVSTGDRGYLFVLFRSPDELDLQVWEWGPWFDQVLSTVQLSPEDAIVAAPTASP